MPQVRDSSAGYLEQNLQSPVFPTDLFFGTACQSLPVDLSEKRLCEVRCFGVLDRMNNTAPGPKILLAENDTYETSPEEDLYAYTNVNYIRLAETPRFDDDWSPIIRALRAGDYFVTSGEVLFESWGLEGTGARRTLNAEVEWTFPLEFAELVWGDGQNVERQIIPATDRGAFGTYRFKIPLMWRGRSGCDLPCGIQRATGRFSSRSTCARSDPSARWEGVGQPRTLVFYFD